MNSIGFLMQQKLGFNGADVSEVSPCKRYAHYKKILGRGAFKDVYGGFDQVSNTEIAWCQICIDDENTMKSLENEEKLCWEAVLLKSLNHKNIMKCFSYWVDKKNNTMNMITELFSSGSLRHYRHRNSNIDVQTIKNWGRQILQGLQYLHSQKPCIIHRDLKGDNIFLDMTTGDVKIGDFGLATIMQEGPLCTVVGTPEYMAPEFYDEEYNELVDIYAFGMCLLELATSEYPYSECTNPAQIFKKVTAGIKPLALGKVKDPEVKEIIEKCLVSASNRPSAVELLKDPFFSSKNPMEIEIERDNEARLKISHRISPSAESALSVEQEMVQSPVDFTVDSTISSFSVEKQFLYSKNNCRQQSIFSLTYASPEKVSRAPSSLYESSTSEVSMNSKITFASSSGEVFGDPGFCISSLSLSGKAQAGD
ncbi:serine/threonine-protein kinase WNK8-like [Forsythia ovata]|uniref:non-specific serine/threonine protein kinase n=1 Tax=Forsythia ovata TaxID=205694 RepID=A0ABD1VEP2_9LAMI